MGSHWVVMGEQPKIKWKSLVVATLFLLVLLPGSLVANGDAEIFTMSGTGGNQQRLTNNIYEDINPSW